MAKLKILSNYNSYKSFFKITWFFTFSAKTLGRGLALNKPHIGATNDYFHSRFVGIDTFKVKHTVSLIVGKNEIYKNWTKQLKFCLELQGRIS